MRKMGPSSLLHDKYRKERGTVIVAACDITSYSISVVFYDITLKRRYARSVLLGAAVYPENAAELFRKVLVSSMREFSLPAAVLSAIGIAAPTHISIALEMNLEPSFLYISDDTEIYIVPFISAALDGRFTAALMALPEGDAMAADFGGHIRVAVRRGERVTCAGFALSGAFDGTGLENGMPTERGAIDSVSREPDGITSYSVVGDIDSAGVSAGAAAMTAALMLEGGILDSDGIMTDRDLFYIGEDYFVSQSDVRVIQSDKARTAAALSLLSEFCGEQGDGLPFFLTGEPFARREGFLAMSRIGALPRQYERAAFCRSSVEQGVILCLESEERRALAEKLSAEAEDISARLADRFEELTVRNMMFGEGE